MVHRITASASIAALNFSGSPVSRASFSTWNMKPAIVFIYRWIASTWCRYIGGDGAQPSWIV